eukprot:CCRYP_019809-RB/>CCRYP_019809-RB protein AED:0.02 eAED:0.02 QI:131/1/1/1/1/0.66/3/1425/983
MSNVCWIDLTNWIALATHHERKWIQDINGGRDHNKSLPVQVAPTNSTHQHFELNVVTLTYVQRCVKVSLLLLGRLTRDYKCHDTDAEPDMIDGMSLKDEDISVHNLVVEILCPVDHGKGDQDFVDIEICSERCTMNGVQLEMNQMQSILDSSNKVEFVQPMKDRRLTKRSFIKSRHQYLQQLGLVFFQLFCRGEPIRKSSHRTQDYYSAVAASDTAEVPRTNNEDDISSASKLMRMMSLDEFKKSLLDARVPASICRLVTDLIHSGKYDEETSFRSFADVLDELQDIISGRPHVLLYDRTTPTLGCTSSKERIDFGNIVYGREVETNRILELAALQHEFLKNRLILISGNGGEGKTFMIEGVKNHLVTLCGWAYVGIKFDRLMHNSPLSAISSAFDQFFSSLLSRRDQEPYVTAITMSLQLHLSPSMTVLLCHLIPSLRRLFPTLMSRVVSNDDLKSLKEDSAEDKNLEIHSDPESSRNRLHYSIRRLVHAISSFGRPLLFVFDDLQWAGRASLDLLTSLMVECDAVHFEENAPIARVMFVGLYRSDEVDQDHVLSKRYFPIFNSTGTVEVHSIQLREITKEACNSMISCALRLPVRLTRSLADIVHAKALGNVFYVKMFLESLVINKTLWYSLTDKRWMWNLESVRATPIAENVAQLMKRNLQTLPEATLWALKLLSCFGSKADEPTLLLLTDHVDIINALVDAIDRNIVEKQGKFYKFAHDILEQSAYDMMSRQEQSNSHLLIGSELIKNAVESNWSHVRPLTFVAIDQINRAKVLGNTQLSYSVQYATLNLKAAQKSMSVSDFASALSYAEHGISFLADHLWDGSNYSLALRLYETASTACFTSSQGDKMRCFLDEVFEHAQSLRDKLHSYLLLIETLGAVGKDGEAIDSAFALLGELGEILPQDLPRSLIQHEVFSIKSALSTYTDDDIKNPPRVTDWNISARMRVIGSVIPFLFNLRPHYIPFLACRIVKLSIQHGKS